MTAATARRAVLAGLVACLFVLMPTSASGHANLVDTDPADGEVVPTAPDRLTVRFDETVVAAAAGNELLDARGRTVDAEFSADGAKLTVVPAEALGDGTYLLRWRVISADSHPVSGGISFSVGEPSESVIPMPSVQEQREVNVLKAVAETVRYGGVLVLAGLAVFGMLAVPVTRRDDVARVRLRRATTGAAVAACAGAVLLVPLTAWWESGEPLGSSSGLTVADPSAVAAVLVVLGAVAILGTPRLGGPALAGAGVGAVLGSLTVVGHTRSYGPAWLVLPADLLHVASAAVWAGGLVGLLIVLASRPRARDAARMVARFSSVAVGAVALLAVGALALYWRISGSFQGLWQTGYGRLVLVKVLVTALVIVLGAWNRHRLVGSVESSGDARRTLRRILAAEAGALGVVVAVTGVLVSVSPRSASLAEAGERTGGPAGPGAVLAILILGCALGAATFRLLPSFRKDLS
ncbi:copper resistance protein CopC/CopD [Aeromicrobium sp. YIM 150415]|uniref:copper resistance CopC/CopD family protein n=1 Tax=Aeromicrobium sp. YIM 150415 TaxID=2803912 RepID=UPI00196636FA|nr:copper resistance protein CopC [Aeromicrobium sp. YIM 150415]MBM9463967.1 copper resistance protein CopC/CopD [Aeromicrobium sp. YIM 150415]